MSLCSHHAPVIASARQAISSHRRHKIAAAIARAIRRQCPSCIATKETK